MKKDEDNYYASLRSSAIQMYYVDGLSVPSILEKIPVVRSTVYHWIRIFASENPEMVEQMKKKAVSSELAAADYKQLKAEILRLRRQLSEAELKAVAYDTMIDVAEEMFNIPIRKKAGTRQ